MKQTDTKAKRIRIRGVGSYDPETQKFGFEPFNEAPSTQTNVKTCSGGGKSWTTTGKDPSRMLSLKCKASSADPYSDLVTQFSATRLPARRRGGWHAVLARRSEKRGDLYGHYRPLTSQSRLAIRGVASGAVGRSPTARQREIQQSNLQH